MNTEQYEKQFRSRLETAERAVLNTDIDVLRHCNEHGIPVGLNFKEIATGGDLENFLIFCSRYRLPPIPQNGLKEPGASLILVMETKMNRNHGEVVAAIADEVGRSLSPRVRTAYIHASINPNYRATFEREMKDKVSELLENQGAAVIHTSIGWDDLDLIMGSDSAMSQKEHLSNIAAFVVDSAGNDGWFGADGKGIPQQKHNAVSHYPPLVVHVGAATIAEGGKPVVDGYSTANGPACVAPVHGSVMVNWADGEKKAPVIGTSAAAPYVSGGLGALNAEYGKYLTREQMLYAVLMTCQKVDTVGAWEKKTPEAATLEYKKNAKGLSYNPTYAGFGLVDFHKAEQVIRHMVAHAQANPQSITVPMEEMARISVLPSRQEPRDDGMYEYRLKMEEGIALKTSFDIMFEKKRGDVKIISPEGTEYPAVLSKAYKNGYHGLGMTTMHGWAGEKTGGEWVVVSPVPIRAIEMRSHQFGARDLVQNITPDILSQPLPNIADARTLKELREDVVREQLHPPHARHPRRHRLQLDGEPIAATDTRAVVDAVSAFAEKNKAISERTRTITHISYPCNEAELSAIRMVNQDDWHLLPNDFQEKTLAEFERAAEGHRRDGNLLAEANVYSMAAQAARRRLELTDSEGRLNSAVAVELMEKAMVIHEKQGHKDFMFRDGDILYGSICATVESLRQLGAKGQVPQYYEKLKPLREKMAEIYTSMQGAADATAHRIEQGEMGFSADKPIGTDNVSQCVVLMLHDPVSKKTGLAHVDIESDKKSLDLMFKRMPRNQLQARIIGARFDSDMDSHVNLEGVIDFLRSRDVDLLSADILNYNGPSAMVVDPKTFEVKEAVPEGPNVNRQLSNALHLFAGLEKDVHLSFDFTISPERAPLLLNQAAVAKLRDEFLGKDDVEIDAQLRFNNTFERSVVSHNIMALRDEYLKQLAVVEAALSQRMQQFSEGGIALSPDAKAQALEWVKQVPMHVGANAEAANQPLIECINTRLFNVVGQEAVVNPDEMNRVKFAKQPFTVIEQQTQREKAYTDKVQPPPSSNTLPPF